MIIFKINNLLLFNFRKYKNLKSNVFIFKNNWINLNLGHRFIKCLNLNFY